MKVAVILVNHNTRTLLSNALQSVYESARASALDLSDLPVLVVDNASRDGSAQVVAEDFPHVRLIALDDNVGFTRANNLALAKLGFALDANRTDQVMAARPDYVLLLNPDAEIMGDALGQMARFMDENPTAGCCGPRLEYGDGAFQHGAFAFPSLGQVAIDLFPVHKLRLARRLYDSSFNGRYPRALWDSEHPFAVDFVLGAALMMRGAAVNLIGGLDEGFFMYCEEMDWCLRLKEAGWDTYAVPYARVRHHEAQSSRQTPWPAFRNLWTSRVRFYTKHRRQFSPVHLFAVRSLMRIAMRQRSKTERRRFAQGRSTGTEAADALASYAFVAHL